jgi:hypothetical protein
MSATAQEMARLAEELNDLVGQFKIENGKAEARGAAPAALRQRRPATAAP